MIKYLSIYLYWLRKMFSDQNYYKENYYIFNMFQCEINIVHLRVFA